MSSSFNIYNALTIGSTWASYFDPFIVIQMFFYVIYNFVLHVSCAAPQTGMPYIRWGR